MADSEERAVWELECESLRLENTQLACEAAELRTLLEESMASLRQRIEEQEALRLDRDVLGEEMAHAQASLAFLRDSLRRAEGQHSEASAALAQAQQQLLVCTEERDRALEAANGSAPELLQLRAARASLQESLETAEQLVEQQATQARQAAAQLAREQQRVRVLERRLVESDAQLASVRAELADVRQQLRAATMEAALLRQRQQHISEIKDTYKHEAIASRERLLALGSVEEELKRSQARLEELHEENQRLKGRLYDLIEHAPASRDSAPPPSPPPPPPPGAVGDTLKQEQDGLREQLRQRDQQYESLMELCQQLLEKVERPPHVPLVAPQSPVVVATLDFRSPVGSPAAHDPPPPPAPPLFVDLGTAAVASPAEGARRSLQPALEESRQLSQVPGEGSPADQAETRLSGDK